MNPIDWLLPQPWNATDWDGEPRWPSLPAFDAKDRPLAPPERHILDHLARTNGFFDEDVLLYDFPIAAGTVHVETGLHQTCDFCDEPGRYDHLLSKDDGGPVGAFLCTRHAQRRVERLGAPNGTVYLMHWSEVTPQVRDRVNTRLTERGMEPIDVRSDHGPTGTRRRQAAVARESRGWFAHMRKPG